MGSGESVSIMCDPWLPVDENPYVSTVSRSLEGGMVINLFCVDGK